VVRRGLERDPQKLPSLGNGTAIGPEGMATLELLKVLLKAAASRHGVAPRLIADTDDLERIAVEPDADVPALKGWRRELFGEDALRLKRGELALVIRNGEVAVVPVRETAHVRG
jgi:ribonuclease D